VRAAARACGRPDVFVVAKIERSGALTHYGAILEAADGIMVARGDLGVEVPIEQIAITQKELIARANLAGKPIITATQMLESMVSSRLPTRAEATDVANAILDGTDCVMLSGESAMGKFPEEAVDTLARIAAETEKHRARAAQNRVLEFYRSHKPTSTSEAMATVVEHALETVPCDAVFVPTHSGTTARMLSRFKPSVWIVAASPRQEVCQGLAFSYGIWPEVVPEQSDWWEFARRWLNAHVPEGRRVLLVSGPSASNPGANHRIEFSRVGG